MTMNATRVGEIAPFGRDSNSNAEKKLTLFFFLGRSMLGIGTIIGIVVVIIVVIVVIAIVAICCLRNRF